MCIWVRMLVDWCGKDCSRLRRYTEFSDFLKLAHVSCMLGCEVGLHASRSWLTYKPCILSAICLSSNVAYRYHPFRIDIFIVYMCH